MQFYCKNHHNTTRYRQSEHTSSLPCLSIPFVIPLPSLSLNICHNHMYFSPEMAKNLTGDSTLPAGTHIMPGIAILQCNTIMMCNWQMFSWTKEWLRAFNFTGLLTVKAELFNAKTETLLCVLQYQHLGDVSSTPSLGRPTGIQLWHFLYNLAFFSFCDNSESENKIALT